jgi:hypothetical protein
MKYAVCMLLILSLFTSCAQKHFSGADYTFYEKGFRLDPSSSLRADGIYILDRIWTDENGGTEEDANEHKFYKFYKTGQCNMILDLENKIKTEEHYVSAIQKDADQNKMGTLFEGYYKLQEDRIVIQRILHPVKQFEYKYGYVLKDTLVLVKSTIEGKGEFKDKFFTDYYKEYYVFKPLDNKAIMGIVPVW